MHINTKILEAIESGDLEAFSRLVGHDGQLRNGANAFGSWLHCASGEGQLAIVRYLVENGADVNLRAGSEEAGPIDGAASSGHLDVLEYLLSKGARLDVSAPTCNPLFSAVYGSQVDVAKLLIDAGIDIHVVYRSITGKLKNALSFAQERDETVIAELLVKAGCRLPIEGVDKPIWEPPPEERYTPTLEDEHHEQLVSRLAEILGPVDALSLQELFPISGAAIHVIRPNASHPFLTLFTVGMSDQPMNVPVGDEVFRYAELIMHLPASWPHPREADEETSWPAEWLRNIACYPFLHETWLGGHLTIISSDDPPVPLGPNTRQTCLLLIGDLDDWSPVRLNEEKEVRYYTVVPIYTEERDFEQQRGIVALLERLEEGGHTGVVNVHRASVVDADECHEGKT